jgi:hypothetical protein
VGKRVAYLVQDDSKTCAQAKALTSTDKERLLSCLSFDGNGCRDRLLIELMSHFGLRSKSMWSIELRDIQIGNPSVGRVSIDFRAIKGRSGCRRLETLPVRLMETFRDYYQFRMSVFPLSKYFFIGKNGEPLTSPSICEMYSELSACAGYGQGFFTGHSPRFGFAAMIAGEVFSRGGELIDIMERLRTSRNWGTRSSAVLGYIDMNINRFFVDGLTHDEFKRMPIVEFHQLTSLGQCCIRRSSWMRRGLGTSAALREGRLILRSVPYVYGFVNSIISDSRARRTVKDRVAREVGDNLWDIETRLRAAAFKDRFETFMRNLCLLRDPFEDRLQQRSKRARSSAYHEAATEEDFERILRYTVSKKRKIYRVVRHPSGVSYTTSRPVYESRVMERQYPDWQRFPLMQGSPSPSESSRHTPSPTISRSSRAQISGQLTPPARSSNAMDFVSPIPEARLTAHTPSTAASLSSLLRGNVRNCL